MATKTVDLLDSYMLAGTTYGPGPTELPDDEAMVGKIKELEKKRRAQIEDEASNELRNLPQGHPYQQLLGALGLGDQPPESEVGADKAAAVAEALKKLGIEVMPFGTNLQTQTDVDDDKKKAAANAPSNPSPAPSGGSGNATQGSGSGSGSGS